MMVAAMMSARGGILMDEQMDGWKVGMIGVLSVPIVVVVVLTHHHHHFVLRGHL